ncbi:hypothetical protein [Buchnera aphidicola]|uniref:hypothetical protein n=1 Tax=Buchnera aphidicola TaxID=9 RepID=UPI00031FFC58|nr:hypothetical protein [Buchnera aphidicola]
MQKIIIKQKYWINYFCDKIQKKNILFKKLFIQLEKWKILELRVKNRIKKENILLEGRQDNILSSNVFCFLLLK